MHYYYTEQRCYITLSHKKHHETFIVKTTVSLLFVKESYLKKKWHEYRFADNLKSQKID